MGRSKERSKPGLGFFQDTGRNWEKWKKLAEMEETGRNGRNQQKTIQMLKIKIY